MNSKTARRLRRIAKGIATEENKTSNNNVDVKSVKSGKRVMDSDGVAKDELVPVVTFTTEYVDDCPREVYQGLKKEYKA